MGQHTFITDCHLAIRISLDFQLDPITGFYLKSDVAGMTVVMVTVTMVMMGLSPHIHNGSRYSQHG